MGRLAALISGNPLALLWLAAAVFAAGCVSGGSAAWWAQGVRVTGAEQRLVAFEQSQKAIYQEHEVRALKDRAASADRLAAAKKELSDEIESGAVYRRCVAAGKCGVPKPSCPSATGVRLPSRVGAHGAVPDPIPARPDPAEAVILLVADCAATTLQLNVLQGAIEAQPGY